MINHLLIFLISWWKCFVSYSYYSKVAVLFCETFRIYQLNIFCYHLLIFFDKMLCIFILITFFYMIFSKFLPQIIERIKFLNILINLTSNLHRNQEYLKMRMTTPLIFYRGEKWQKARFIVSWNYHELNTQNKAINIFILFSF